MGLPARGRGDQSRGRARPGVQRTAAARRHHDSHPGRGADDPPSMRARVAVRSRVGPAGLLARMEPAARQEQRPHGDVRLREKQALYTEAGVTQPRTPRAAGRQSHGPSSRSSCRRAAGRSSLAKSATRSCSSSTTTSTTTIHAARREEVKTPRHVPDHRARAPHGFDGAQGIKSAAAPRASDRLRGSPAAAGEVRGRVQGRLRRRDAHEATRRPRRSGDDGRCEKACP